jgi:outer membrane lipoprotein SlyB
MVGSRNYPLLIGAGVALVISGLVGAAAMTGVLPATESIQADCANCGVIAAVRTVQVQDERASARVRMYHITVRMDDGSERTVTQVAVPAQGVGARVRLNGNALGRG